MLLVDSVPAVEQSCDVAGARAEAARLNDQAFAAMRAATEAVDAAARGANGGDADRLWADYKRLRQEAARLRDQPCEPPTVRVAQTPPPAAQSAPYADSSSWRSSSPRFRVEGAISLADRQPTRASRLATRESIGVATQIGGSYSYSVFLPPPPQPPAPSFPAPTRSNSNFVGTGASTVGAGPQPKVRSWSNGLDLAFNFSPQGLDNAGWRFRGMLSHDDAVTKSSIGFSPSGYQGVGTPAVTFGCSQSLAAITCRYTQTTPVTVTGVLMPGGSLQSFGVQDSLRQEAQNTEARLNVSRQFGVSALNVPLRLRVGGELGVGWWTVHEREWLSSNAGSIAYTRDVDGPTGLVALTGGVSGDLWGPFSWSIDGMIGRQTADLTYFWAYSSASSGSSGGSSTQRDTGSEAVGSLGGRVDFVHNSWNAFISAERRRDMSISSSLTGLDAPERYSVLFPDGTRGGVWPVYSSRLRVGVGYSF
jgi:hypothetical protein